MPEEDEGGKGFRRLSECLSRRNLIQGLKRGQTCRAELEHMESDYGRQEAHLEASFLICRVNQRVE